MATPEDRVLQSLGINPNRLVQPAGTPEEEDEEGVPTRRGFGKSFVMGAAQGLLEPLGFLPPVGDFIEAHLDPRGGNVDPRGSNLGRALGFVAGFALPTGVALKAGSGVVRGGTALARGYSGANAIRHAQMAEAFTDLGAVGNLARGSIAGALLGAGRDAEDAGDRAKNIATEAALFGLGDAIAFPVFRAIGTVGGAASTRLAQRFGKTLETGVVQEADAELLGGVLKMADKLFPEEAVAEFGVSGRRAQIELGLSNAEFGQMAPGEFAAISGITDVSDDLVKIFRRMPEVEYRKVDFITPEGVKKTDILAGRKGSLDDRLVDEYKRNAKRHGVGFVRGQKVRYDGAEYVITGPGPIEGLVKGYIPGRASPNVRAKNTDLIDLDVATVMPIASWRAGPREVKGARKLWGEFVEQHGQFPQAGFESAFAEFAEGMAGAEREQLREYFALRTIESLSAVDRPLANALEDIKKLQGTVHPDGDTAVLAAQHGYMAFPDIIEGGRRATGIRDVMTGRQLNFPTNSAAQTWLKANARDLPDFLPPGVDPPIPFNFFGLKGTGVARPHTAVDISSWYGAPKWLALAQPVLPRYSWLRNMQEVVNRTLPKDVAPQFFGPFSRLQQNIVQSRRAMEPWGRELQRIFGKRKYDAEKLRNMMAVLENPRGWRETVKDLHGLSDVEFQTVQNVDEFIRAQLRLYIKDRAPNLGKKKVQDLTDEFLDTYYYRYIRVKPPHGSGRGDWVDALTTEFAEQGREPNRILLQLGREMESTGIGPGRFENNPFMLALSFMRTVHTKIHVDENFKEIRAIVQALPDEGDLQMVKHTLEDYLKTTYGGSPEAYAVLRMATEGTFKSLGIKMEEKEMDRLINTLVGLNYGAFMAFRPALAVRNLTQTLTTTLPMIQDPVAMAKGIKAAMTRRGRDMAREAGAIPTRSVAQPMEDVLYRQYLAEQFKASGRALPDKLRKTIERAEKMGQLGLGTEQVTVAGRKFNIGFYSTADEWNRAIAYHAQRHKTIRAMQRWRSGPNRNTQAAREAFDREAGLTFFGTAQRDEFHRIADSKGRQAAIDWLGLQAANETQWVYQLGAGPSMFSHGVGRLFGMYGTWPSWYAAHLARGAQRFADDPVGAARFWGWSAAVWAALPAAGVAIGTDLSRWSPLSSFTWAGGPAVDWFKDATDIMSGATPQGPTAGRALALSRFGLRDRGNDLGIPYLGYLDPRPDSGLDIEDPVRAAMHVLEQVTPGMLAVKDLLRAQEEPTLRRAISRAVGFQPTPGHAWPRFQAR